MRGFTLFFQHSDEQRDIGTREKIDDLIPDVAGRRDENGEQLAVLLEGVDRLLYGVLLAEHLIKAEHIFLVQDVDAERFQKFIDIFSAFERLTDHADDAAVVQDPEHAPLPIYGQIGIIRLCDAHECVGKRRVRVDARHVFILQGRELRRRTQKFRHMTDEPRKVVARLGNDAVFLALVHDDVAKARAEQEIVLVAAHRLVELCAAADEIGKLQIPLAAVDGAEAGIDGVIRGNKLDCIAHANIIAYFFAHDKT